MEVSGFFVCRVYRFGKNNKKSIIVLSQKYIFS